MWGTTTPTHDSLVPIGSGFQLQPLVNFYHTSSLGYHGLVFYDSYQSVSTYGQVFPIILQLALTDTLRAGDFYSSRMFYTLLFQELVRALDTISAPESAAFNNTDFLSKGMFHAYDAFPFVDVSSNDTETTGRTYSWTYDGSPFVTLPYYPFTVDDPSVEDDLPQTDSSLIKVKVILEDDQPSTDSIITNAFGDNETAPNTDSTLIKIKVKIEDDLPSTDSVFIHNFDPVYKTETAPNTDTNLIKIKTFQEEDQPQTDSLVVFSHPPVTNDWEGMRIPIAQYKDDQETLNVSIGTYQDELVDLDIEIVQYTLPAMVDFTSSSNPYAPTVAVGGTILASNVATNPGNTFLHNTSAYVHYLSSAISGNDWTDLWNFSFELDYSGGHFSIDSRVLLNTSSPAVSEVNPLGLTTLNLNSNYFHYYNQGPYVQLTSMDSTSVANVGYIANIFGLKGIITDFGPKISDNEAAWVSSGTFGAPFLNRNFTFLLFNTALSSILTQTNTGTTTVGVKNALPGGGYFNATTARALAFQIAQVCGVTLHWAVPDIPINTSFRYDGMTGAQVIANLAAQCGGTLRWDGNTNYYVAYPNQSFGVWEVPDCRLLTPAGTGYQWHLDLETGLTGTGLLLMPKLNTTQNTKTTPSTGLPTLQRVGQLQKKKTVDDVEAVWDLPYNYDKVFIQILVGPNGDTGGVNLVDTNNFITKDPTEWFEFSTDLLETLGVSTEYIFNAYLGNAYIPQVKVDYGLFPGGGIDGINTSIDDGFFVLSMACSTKDLSGAFSAAQQNAQNLAQNQLAAALQASRFIKTYSGVITCQFFGSIPLPGMWGKVVVPGGATIRTFDPNTGLMTTAQIPLSGDLVVEGVIETVQFSFPGTLTVTVAQYARINFGSVPMTNISMLGGAFL